MGFFIAALTGRALRFLGLTEYFLLRSQGSIPLGQRSHQMRKIMQYEHLDTGVRMEVAFDLDDEGGRWAARMETMGAEGPIKAPVFYGKTPEQAERQLRKVFEKEYELLGQSIVEK